MDVGTWLGELGLGQYEAIFRENQIEADLLPELADEHLKELGIPLGHRLRMLRAIRALGDVSRAAPEQNLKDAAERRELTIMSCDLVGSTALTAQLDPEDMADLIRAFHGAVVAAVSRFNGHVAKWMGDGALVYFGYPRAHADDAERAVRAAIALIDAVARLRLDHHDALEVRIGISTGLVVIGELLGEGEARLRGLVGDTPDLAMRLQALAEPDTILVSESTRRLLGKAFALKPPERQAFKDMTSPVSAWRIVRARERHPGTPAVT